MRSRLLLIGALLGLAACNPQTNGTGSGTVTVGTSSEGRMSIAQLEKSAADGNATAMFELGAAYHDGDGVEKNLDKALQWFKKSAELNYPQAQFNLGVMYYTADGTPKNLPQARRWFERAEVQGNPRAAFNLGVMYYNAEGVKTDYAKANEYFLKAVAAGSGEAAFNIGVMHVNGQGFAKNPVEALAWFLLGKDLGSAKAEQAIQTLSDTLSASQKTAAATRKEELRKSAVRNGTGQPTMFPAF